LSRLDQLLRKDSKKPLGFSLINNSEDLERLQQGRLFYIIKKFSYVLLLCMPTRTVLGNGTSSNVVVIVNLIPLSITSFSKN
jgi:hypothetical protein